MTFDLKGKKVLIMGLGLHGGGVGTVLFFTAQKADVTITDLRTQEELRLSLDKLKHLSHVHYVLGRHRTSDFLHADLIVKNPGVAPSSPYLLLARKKNIPITTDMGIFLRACPASIIGITGTRGKSTTAYLIARFLEALFRSRKKDASRKVFLGGNIRTSVFDFIDTATKNDVIVLELSSFQLDDIAHDSWHIDSDEWRSPHIAVLTNIMRDHLNWHGSMAHYISAKSIIFRFQSSHDVLFANNSDLEVKKMSSRAKSHVVFPHLPAQFKSLVDRNLGAHYRTSSSLAIDVARHFGASLPLLKSVLTAVHGLPGRQEIIATIRGITVVNDTTATIPEASIAAIMRFRDRAQKNNLILIAGGSNKNLLFADMARAIKKYVDRCILLPGTATEKLVKKLNTKNRGNKTLTIGYAPSMQQAVTMAFESAKKGDVLVLSPGAASFGLFANEFDRGDAFIKAIQTHRY
ncbi:MAG: UDP-N-acetylmuramoyl-L-alanine--D-glutamate ligase [bacterium]|nr:UDP-N-acetylmuramoyl-L-alanine--D-glutamate ligase [bacterium]